MITIFVSLINVVVQSAVALLSLAIASRYLDVDSFSIWALAGATFAYVSLLDAGASMIVQRNVASRRPDLVHDAETMAKTLFVVIGGAGLAVFVIGELASEFVYIAMIGSMMIRVSVNVLGAVLVAEGAAVAERISRMSSSATLLLLQYVLLHGNLGIASWGISVLVAAGVYLAMLLALSGSVRRIMADAVVAFSMFRKYRSDHVNWLFYTIPGLFIYNFQVFGLKFWATIEAVAVFAAAHQLYYSTISVFSITSVLSSVAISKHHYAQSERRNETVFTNLRTNSLLVTLALVLVSVLLIPLGSLLFPRIPFGGYWLVFAAYGFFLVLEAAQMALTNALISAGETDFKLVNIVSAMLNVVGCYLLVPHFGISGAVLAVGMAQLVTCNYYNIRKAIRLLSLPVVQVVRTIGLSLIIYLVLVSAHWLAHGLGNHAGNVVDALIVCGIAAFELLYVLPRLLGIVEEYRLSKSP